MTDPQAAQLGAVAAGLAILAFYGVAFLLLLLGVCHLWLDLRERLAERRAKRKPPRHGPSGPPPLKLRRSCDPGAVRPGTPKPDIIPKPQYPPPQVIRDGFQVRWPTRDDRLDNADVVRYLRQRDQRLQRALTDEINPPPEAP